MWLLTSIACVILQTTKKAKGDESTESGTSAKTSNWIGKDVEVQGCDEETCPLLCSLCEWEPAKVSAHVALLFLSPVLTRLGLLLLLPVLGPCG